MASGSFAVASSNKYVSCTCWWSSSTNTNGNYSTVNFELRASRTNSGYTTYGTGSGNVTINGTTVSFSITSSQKITQDSNTLLGSGSVVVYHNDDGSKSITISAYATIPGASLTLGTTSTNVTLDTIARASTPTLNGTVFTITKANSNFMRIYTNRKSSSFTHHIYYSFNGSSEVGLTSGVEDYYDWYFPDTLADNIPNVASATGYIRLYTFNNGTNIGNKTVSFTMQVNDDFLPSVTFEIADAEGYFEQYGKYIQGNSKVTGTISAEGCYGATIKSYKTTFDGKSYSDPEFTTDAIVSSGTQVISVSVTDSRGKTTIVENEVEIYEYKTPKITSVKAKRCTKDGASSSQGDYLSFMFSSKVTALDGLNPVIYSVEFRSISENSYTATILDGYENQHEVEDGNYIFAAEKEAYSIILTVADGFGYTQKRAIGPSVSVLFSRLWKGLGYAVGKFAELENVFDIGFKTRFSGGILCLVLEEGADLNETLTPNIYAGQDVGTAGYLNVPTDYAEGKFTLDVVSCGDNGELKQTFSTCSKENSQVYVRFYYDGEWGEWINQFAELNSKLLENVYPVGSIYVSVMFLDPGTVFGGTWKQIKDTFLLSAGDSYEAGSSGGSTTHSHDDGSLVAAIGSAFGLANTLAFCAGSTGPLTSHNLKPTYTLSATNVTATSWSHSTGVYGDTGKSSSMPPYLAVYMWQRIA